MITTGQIIIPKISTTDIIVTIPTMPNITNSNSTKAILVGYSGFKRNPYRFSFYTHFATVENYLYSDTVSFNILVDNEQVEAKCTLQDRELITNAKYLCEVPFNKTNIEKISINPDFHFDNQENVTLVGITPFATMYMDDIQNIGDNYDYISDANIYVIEHSQKVKYNKNNFNISGIMFNSKADFTSKNFDLLIYLSSGNKTQVNVSCSFADVKEVSENSYYTVSCMSDDDLEGQLQTAIAFIDDDILVIYFDNSTESEIDINTNEEEKAYNYRYYKNKETKVGKIVLAIVLPLAFVLALVITFVLIKRRTIITKPKNVEDDSINMELAI